MKEKLVFSFFNKQILVFNVLEEMSSPSVNIWALDMTETCKPSTKWTSETVIVTLIKVKKQIELVLMYTDFSWSPEKCRLAQKHFIAY